MVIDMKTMLSKVMKKAWEIKKENNENLFSLCLKMAWSIIRKGVNKVVELVGTEKQVAWAKDIKANMINAISRFIENNKEDDTTTVKLVIEAAKNIENETSSIWFINNRTLVSESEGNQFFDFEVLISEKEGFKPRAFRRMQERDWATCK